MAEVSTLLMFQGEAAEALELYLTAFEDASVDSISHYQEGEEGTPGHIKHALVDLEGTYLVLIDSSVPHDFGFTPSMSLYVQCHSLSEIDHQFGLIAEGGEIFMPLDNYGFSERFGWCADRFGVSWQFNLAPELPEEDFLN